MANFYLGQIFGTKEEAKKLIRKHAVETRRLIKMTKDDHIRVRAVCTGSKPDFEVDDGGVHASKKKKTKDKGASGKNSKSKGAIMKKGKPKGGWGTGAESNVGGRGKMTNPNEYQCPWVMLLSKEKDSQYWVVRTLNTNHTCIQSRHIYACTSTFVSEMLEQIEEDPNISLKAVQGQFRRKYGVSVHKMKAYRAKMKAYRANMKAKNRVEGDYKEQYSLLREYAAELVDKNPGSTVKIEVEPPTDPESTTRQFKRIYVAGIGRDGGEPWWLRRGEGVVMVAPAEKALNKDLLGLDGAFMKGTFPGQMLTAVGLDSNNGIYPVCYAIVESESNNSWNWFLELLSEDMEIGSNSRFTFMSDRKKGLLQAIQTLFPCAEHRYCLRHIHENMKLAGYRGVLYKNMLYNCATKTTKPEFLTAMNELKEFNKEGHLFGRAVSDVMINNMCEVYNGKIVEGRDRPIISALEYVREYLMRRIVTVLGIIDKCDGLLTPRATELFATIQNQANHYHVQWNGGDLYGASGKPTDPRVVNLELRTCTCRGWEITGLSCRHAVAALWVMAANGERVGALESWVHPVHTMDRWKLVYSFKINPINGMPMWTKCEAPTTIVAPKHHTMAGRPKKARKRSVVENDDIPSTGKLTRRSGKRQLNMVLCMV
ncbi:uncharacterized protein LOC143586481 [Bidens hawaiensis]|uniref:uncharacterized protein LOC143586481 n=1 Tax=Bidens hawaiensis TaxID=980011 RepID=UPI00404A2C7A